MGWQFKWLSSYGTDFNYDFGVSFTPEEVAKGRINYNYERGRTRARSGLVSAPFTRMTRAMSSTPIRPTAVESR